MQRLAATCAAALAALIGCAGPEASAEPSIVSARYDGPTRAYPHAVLGDDVEYTILRLTLSDGSEIVHQLPQAPMSRVFEDLAPRLADVDGDGAPEVIAVESDFELGGQLSIWDETGRIAQTPNIGRRFRWLAPVGAADFDGDGAIDVAFVDRPHLAKTLTIYSFRNGSLELVAKKPGLTNHRIGEPFISGGLRDCGAGVEMITANSNWSQVMASTLSDGEITSRPIGAFSGPDSFAAALNCS